MAKLTLNKNPEKREIDGNFSKAELLRRIKTLEGAQVEDRSPDTIQTGKPFEGLFPIKPEVLDQVARSMKADGYDRTQPVIVWREGGILIDGYTRRKAAIQAGLKNIPVVLVSFPDEAAAVQYAYSLQFNRRNLTDGDRFILLEGLSANVGRKSDSTGGRPKQVLNRQDIANLLTVSTGTAGKYLSVLKNAPEKVKGQVRSGDLSINQADKIIKPDPVKQSNNSEPAADPHDNTPDNGPLIIETGPEELPESGKDPIEAPEPGNGYSSTREPGKPQNSHPKRRITDIAVELIESYKLQAKKEKVQETVYFLSSMESGVRDFVKELNRAGLVTDKELKEFQKKTGRGKEDA